MPYVMVPVPEEHVEEVMQLIIRASARAAQKDWDQESVSALYDEIDEESRSLLSIVARAILSGNDLTERDAASSIELNVRETIGIVRDINEQARESEHANVIQQRRVDEVLPNGRTREKKVLAMEPEVAAMVQEAERADLLANPHPLADG